MALAGFLNDPVEASQQPCREERRQRNPHTSLQKQQVTEARLDRARGYCAGARQGASPGRQADPPEQRKVGAAD